MGYTHYFLPPQKPENFKEFSDECKVLYENLPKEIKQNIGSIMGDGGKPMFEDFIVGFNGIDDLSHEAFVIQSKDKNVDFCKTARKPYDLLVVACLIAANQHIGTLFASDGFDENPKISCDDLQPGIDFYNKVVKPKTPITQQHLIKIRKKFYQKI